MPFSCLQPQIQDKFREYSESYRKAELALKYCEMHQLEGLSFPAVNELRYAGQHIARAFLASTLESTLKCLNDAVRHTKRAMYDAYDASVNFYIAKCREFEGEYKDINITFINNNYLAEKAELNRVIDEISNEDRSHSEDYCEMKVVQIQIVEGIYKKWDDSRGELNKYRTCERKKTWYQLLGLLGACATLILSIIGCLIA